MRIKTYATDGLEYKNGWETSDERLEEVQISEGLDALDGKAFRFVPSAGSTAGSGPYVQLPTPVVATASFTVAGWARITGLAAGRDSIQMIFEQRTMRIYGLSTHKPVPATENNNLALIQLFADDEGRAGFRIRSHDPLDSGNKAINPLQEIAVAKPTDGVWHHYAGVVDGGPIATFSFYVDGEMKGSLPLDQTGIYDQGPGGVDDVSIIQIGASSALEDNYVSPKVMGLFNGRIDDVVIYAEALSAAEVEGIAAEAPPYSGASVTFTRDAWIVAIGGVALVFAVLVTWYLVI
jgi:hypothetical protein